MFYLADKTEDLSLGCSLSDGSDGLLQTGKGKPGHSGDLQQKPGIRNIKRLLLIKENQTSQVKEFSAFLCMGRCQSLGSLKSSLWFAPQLPGAAFLHPGSLQGTEFGAASVAESLAVCSLFVSILSPLRGHCWGSCHVMAWWLQNHLFTDMAVTFFIHKVFIIPCLTLL